MNSKVNRMARKTAVKPSKLRRAKRKHGKTRLNQVESLSRQVNNKKLKLESFAPIVFKFKSDSIQPNWMRAKKGGFRAERLKYANNKRAPRNPFKTNHYKLHKDEFVWTSNLVIHNPNVKTTGYIADKKKPYKDLMDIEEMINGNDAFINKPDEHFYL